MGKYKYSSLCKVYEGYDGNMRIRRIADVADNTILDGFAEKWPGWSTFMEEDGPKVKNFIGVWKWSLKSNKEDSSRDYILTAYDGECIPIEIILLSECSNIQDVVKKLIKGIKKPVLSEKNLYACQLPGSKKYVGVLCTRKEIIEEENVTRLKDYIVYLPQYEFLPVDVLKFNDRMVHKSIDLPPSDQIVYAKDVLEVVRDIVLARASWTAMKQKGLTRHENKIIREFIAEIPISSPVEEVASKIGCNLRQAQELIDTFTEYANEYINGDNIDNDILSLVIQNSPELIAKCNAMLLDDWKEENSKIIAEAESDLNDVKGQIAAEKNELDKLNQEYANREESINLLKQEMISQEKLATDVENQIKARIESAKQDAASFIATQAFVAPELYDSHVYSTKTSAILEKEVTLDGESMEKCNDWCALVELLQYEIEDEGVSNKYSEYVAAFLYAAYINNSHVLLIGPNARAIADAFSACVMGRTCTYLYCEGKYDSDILDKIEKSDESLILIDNLFDPEWNRHINNFASKSSKFIMATNPYVEDLLIEPKGIINYWTPLMTELFVEKKPANDFSGGKKTKNFLEFKSSKTVRGSGKCLEPLTLSTLSRLILKKLISDMFLIVNGEYNVNAELLLAGIPCAYILGEINKLNEYRTDSLVDNNLKEILDRYLGDFE